MKQKKTWKFFSHGNFYGPRKKNVKCELKTPKMMQKFLKIWKQVNAGTRILSFIPVMEWTNSEKKNKLTDIFVLLFQKLRKKIRLKVKKKF